MSENGYEWGDPKNPDHVEWLLGQIDQRRKEKYADIDQHDVTHDTYGNKGEPRITYNVFTGDYDD